MSNLIQESHTVYVSVQTLLSLSLSLHSFTLSFHEWNFVFQCHPMVWSCTVAPLWQRKARRRKSTSTLSLLNQSTPPCISVTTNSTLRWAYCHLYLGTDFFFHPCKLLDSLGISFSHVFGDSITQFFHTLLTQALTALLSDDSKFGFIVIDGSGALFGTLQGNTREVLHKFTVDLPKKHGTDPPCSCNTWLLVSFESRLWCWRWIFKYAFLFFSCFF